MWELCSICSPDLLYKGRLWDCGNFVMVEYINTEQFLLTRLGHVPMTMLRTHSERYKFLQVIFLIFLQLMDAKDQTEVMNNKTAGKGRTEDHFDLLAVLFTRREKKISRKNRLC